LLKVLHFFLFGLTAEQVFAFKQRGYHPREIWHVQPVTVK